MSLAQVSVPARKGDEAGPELVGLLVVIKTLPQHLGLADVDTRQDGLTRPNEHVGPGCLELLPVADFGVLAAGADESDAGPI
jgi:hypothetical protein